MGKITFRADDKLVDRIEEFDASKSEVMREALRDYLDRHGTSGRNQDTIDDALADRVDSLIEERLDQYLAGGVRPPALPPGSGRDINLNVRVDGASGRASVDRDSQESEASDPAPDPEDIEAPASDPERTCGQCGESLSASHVYCPNCGEKASRRVFCECGDELRSDWAFCPGCGRRTPAADVLDQA